MTWKKIAGRGSIGDTNWGVNFDDKNNPDDVKSLLEEVRKHIGEEVLLTGGGSPLWSGGRVGVLKDAKISEMFKDGYRIQVTLERLDPPIAGRTTFTPYLDSWQISVWDDDEK